MGQLKHLSIICSICCLHLFGQIGYGQNRDINMLRAINPQNPSSGFWQAMSNSVKFVAGTASLGSLAYALIDHNKELQYKSYELIGAIAINAVASGALKTIFNRPRPHETYPDEIFVLTTSSGHSFPSGHTSLAFATATSLSLTHKKWYVIVPAYLWAGCVGYSRLYLGRHYPSDVICGAVVGAGSSVLSHWLTKKIFKQPPAGTTPSNSL